MVDNIEKKYTLLNSKVTIVIAGQFHPGVFTPDWFESHQIVSKENCESAKIKFIDSSVVHIDFGWFGWYSEPQKIMIELNTDGYDNQMLDLTRSILNMFSYTKVSAIGINFAFSINIHATEDWHAIGHSLAPKEIWKQSFGRNDLHYGLKETAIQVDNYYGENSLLNMTLKAANSINDKKHNHRLHVEFNNHFTMPDHNSWNDDMELALGKYFEIKKVNLDGYQKLFSSILGDVK
ncbi:hypothetical protein NS381_03330 [Pantoea stewartii]|nr:hypothetical protein NS381_03330 [Pantoea stewartii]